MIVCTLLHHLNTYCILHPSVIEGIFALEHWTALRHSWLTHRIVVIFRIPQLLTMSNKLVASQSEAVTNCSIRGFLVRKAERIDGQSHVSLSLSFSSRRKKNALTGLSWLPWTGLQPTYLHAINVSLFLDGSRCVVPFLSDFTELAQRETSEQPPLLLLFLNNLSALALY